MALIYAAGFQVGGSNGMTFQVDTDDAIIDAGFYMAGSLTTASVTDQNGVAWQGQAYTSFASAVQTAMNATPAGPGFTVTWSTTTGLYTLSHGSTFALDFANNDEGDASADALGFARSGSYSGANSYTSVKVPRYVMASAISARTGVVGPFEPDDIAEMSVSDGGDDFVITVKTSEQLMMWQQQMEPRSSVYIKAATANSAVTSWQDWFQRTRGTHPFWCSDVLEGEPNGVFYRLTGKGASFAPRRTEADYDGYWTIQFDTHWLGTYTP